jgi:hypothetical protein
MLYQSHIIPRLNYTEVLENKNVQFPFLVGRDSSVRIATRYGLEGPGIESRWARDFPHPSRPALGPTQPPVPGHSRG